MKNLKHQIVPIPYCLVKSYDENDKLLQSNKLRFCYTSFPFEATRRDEKKKENQRVVYLHGIKLNAFVPFSGAELQSTSEFVHYWLTYGGDDTNIKTICKTLAK